MLSDSEFDGRSDGDVQLTINHHFAKAYAAKKEREELSKLEEKYGADGEAFESEDDEEDEESDDEDGEELTPAVDAAILRTLARIKRKDPDIYDKDKSIFQQEQERTGRSSLHPKTSTRDNSKPITIKQHALSSMLEAASRSPSPEPMTHEQEQHILRSETVSAFHNALGPGDDAGGSDDDLLVLREKTKDEVEREEEEYREFLEREVGDEIKGLITVEEDSSAAIRLHEGETEDGKTNGEVPSKGKKSKKGKEEGKPETDQEFLMNYILNRGWIDKTAKRIPTYNEITHPGNFESASGDQVADQVVGEALLDDEDEFEDIVEQFESSYNFRFEEPDAAVIATYPRDLPSTVRRQDTTRKEARQRRKERKEKEIEIKKEEVKRLKSLKMKELRQKLEKIGKEGGVDIDTEAFADFDLEGDWDPEKHDKQMAGIYDEEGPEDREKPHWDDDIDVGDLLLNATAGPVEPKSKKKKKQKGDDSTVDGVDIDAMDADIPQTLDEEEWDGTEEMRKRKVQEYMDEMYKLDFNDMVGDMPTRFKYTPVSAQTYALTPAEILLATDGELNEYMGIKRIAPYRKDSRWDVKRADRLKELKGKLKLRSWAGADGAEGKKRKKRKGKKERQRAKGEELGEDGDGSDTQAPAKKRRK